MLQRMLLPTLNRRPTQRGRCTATKSKTPFFFPGALTKSTIRTLWNSSTCHSVETSSKICRTTFFFLLKCNIITPSVTVVDHNLPITNGRCYAVEVISGSPNPAARFCPFYRLWRLYSQWKWHFEHLGTWLHHYSCMYCLPSLSL